MTTVLQQRDRARAERRRILYDETRRRLREALADLIPGQRIRVFGSLTKPGVFNDRSDIDVAIETEPAGMTTGQLMSELTERLARPVDLILLPRCRFRARILREGETWTC